MKPTTHFRANARVKGMTLTELLVVLAILGVLLLLAMPVLTPLFSMTHAMEAKNNLKYLAELEELHYLSHARYTDEFEELAFVQPKLVSEPDGTAHYQIEIVKLSKTDFLARATAITDFDRDDVFNIWEIDKRGIPREVVKD